MSTVASLPPGWVVAVSKSTGRQYWFNTRTNESSYTFPAHALGPAPAPAAPLPALAAGSSVVAPMPPPAKRGRPDEGDGTVPIVRAPDSTKALAVASAYDSLRDAGKSGRTQSSILHLRNFNNWVKATLIQEYAPKPTRRLLDLACGKLGDLSKWRLAGVERYCGVDISATGIADARVRFNDTVKSDGRTLAKLVRADIGCVDLTAAGVFAAAPGEETFDAISIQFALHYLFATEQRALAFFRNIAGRLAPGGVFLGTTTDADVLVRRLRDVLGGRDPAEVAPTWGNEHYTVAFTPDGARRQYGLADCPYGCEYVFYLADSVDRVPEYLVPWPLLVRLAASVGLEPLAGDNFHTWFDRHSRNPAHV